MTVESLAGWGILLPTIDALGAGPRPVLDVALRAEESGFDSAWAGDHLAFGVPLLESTCALAAASAVTSRIRLGYSVMLLASRQPAWVAKQLATLDALAPERVGLGVGVGQPPGDWEASGIDKRTRGKRTDEMIPVVQALLRGEAVDHPGPLAPVRSAALAPVPGRELPLVVGGVSDAGLRRAARFGDGWLASMIGPKEIETASARLRELAEQEGRPTPEVMLAVFCCVSDDPARDREVAQRYIQAQHGIPFDYLEPFSPIGSPEMIADHLGSLREAGVTGFVLMPLSADPVGQVDRLAGIRSAVLG